MEDEDQAQGELVFVRHPDVKRHVWVTSPKLYRVSGTFSSSLVLVDGAIYATDESGKNTIFQADPKEFKLIDENQLGREVFGTPAITGNLLSHRVAESIDGQWREFLYCIESAP